MNAHVPEMAPLVVFSFLATGFALVLCLLVVLYGLFTRSRRVLAGAGASGLAIVATYCAVLLSLSIFSREVDLPVGGKKYFCEIDCHISDAVEKVSVARSVGGKSAPLVSNGQFLVVALRTWFDPSTISPTRGDGPLTPNSRVVVLQDQEGHLFGPSARAQEVLAAAGLHSTPLRTPLRPGKSYTSFLVFEVPNHTENLKLWLGSDDEVGRLLWGDERSPFHGKVVFGLGSAASPTRSAS